MNVFLVVCSHTPSHVLFDSADFTVKPASTEEPPNKLLRSHLFFSLFIHLDLCATSESKEHLVPLGCAVTTLRLPHQSSLHPACKKKKKKTPATRTEEEERKSGTNSSSHTPQICLCSWKNCNTHLWCSIENPSISVPAPLGQIRPPLQLPRSPFCCTLDTLLYILLVSFRDRLHGFSSFCVHAITKTPVQSLQAGACRHTEIKCGGVGCPSNLPVTHSQQSPASGHLQHTDNFENPGEQFSICTDMFGQLQWAVMNYR